MGEEKVVSKKCKRIYKAMKIQEKGRPIKVRPKRVTKIARMGADTYRRLKLAAFQDEKTVSRFLDFVVADFFERYPEYKNINLLPSQTK